MEAKRNNRLITKVFIIGAVIAALSYLFHPEAGQLNIVINGQPIAEPLVRFAAVPTFLMIMGLAITLVVLLFLGIGVFFGIIVHCICGLCHYGVLFLTGASAYFSDHCINVF